MSFVIAAPEIVAAAAGNLAGVGSTLGEATAAAAGPTTSITAAAADDVSLAISETFGAYGRQFQAFGAQASAFHNEFVSLLNGGAAAYVGAEAANAEQTLASAVSLPAATSANAADTILGILNLGGGTGGGLQGLESLLPGLFGTSSGGVVPYPNPYQVLGETTVINLNLMGSTFASHPFPILNQVISNQNGYAQEFGSGLLFALQNYPTTLANVPANIQLITQGASTFNPAALGQLFINGTSGYYGTVGTSLQNFGTDIQGTFPTFEYDMGLAGNAIYTGDYHGAVQDGAHAVLGLFISGFNTSQLVIGANGLLVPLDLALTIAGPIGLLGPAGDLLPILTATGQQAQGLASLIPPTSIPGQIAGNFANAISTLTNSSVTADFAVDLVGSSATLTGDAVFGLPLQLGFAVLGAPFATLDGLATGATAFSTALQAGNALGALNAIGDTPAYVLNGFLNGQVMVDLQLPVTVTTLGLTFTLPATAHVPFDGILTPPQPLTVTVPLNAFGIDIPINATLGGTEFGGLLPTLLNTVPDQLALAISPNYSSTTT
jgi:hypothetical protein